MSELLTSAQFAELAGITERAARDAMALCAAGGHWRGNHQLEIVAVHGRKGGRSGVSYRVTRASVEAVLRDRQAQASIKTAGCSGEMPDRYEVIRPIFAHQVGSPERRQAIRTVAASNGLTVRCIEKWIAAYERKGLLGLTRKARADRGTKRVLISREWDRATAGIIADAARADIAAQLQRKVRSLWAGLPVSSWSLVARSATAHLVHATRAAGLDLSNAELLKICEVPRRFVEAEREYRKLAIRDHDAKAFADHELPRVRRTRAGLRPMEVVIGDVHHLDILFRRDDGSTCTPKLIGWLDAATNRIFGTVVFVEPGQGIRQVDVVRSFIDMTQHPEWGMPASLYLDNGTEFKKLGFVDDAMKLADLPQAQGFRIGFVEDHPEVLGAISGGPRGRRSMIINALPYNAASKPVESIFGLLERGPFALIPGWIGGNRMASKTKNVGQAPTPFPGGHEEFASAVRTALDYYHSTRQSGHLGGRSPNEAFRTHVEHGWKRIDIEREALETVFATIETRIVRQSAVEIRGVRYSGGPLLTLPAGTKVEIRIPIVAQGAYVYVFDRQDHCLGVADAQPEFGFLQGDGARHKTSLVRAQSKAISAKRAEVDPIDPVAEMAAYAELHPAAPAVESGGLICLSPEHQAMAAAARETAAQRRKRIEREEDRFAKDQTAVLQQLLRMAG